MKLLALIPLYNKENEEKKKKKNKKKKRELRVQLLFLREQELHGHLSVLSTGDACFAPTGVKRGSLDNPGKF